MASSSSGARILIIDDDELVARVLQRALHGYDVSVLLDPREALEQIAAGARFDVIVCDLMMPFMTGARLHDQIAQHAPEQARRMIFVTGGAMTPETEELLEGSQQPILDKPVSLARLRQEVQRVLESDGGDGGDGR